MQVAVGPGQGLAVETHVPGSSYILGRECRHEGDDGRGVTLKLPHESVIDRRDTLTKQIDAFRHQAFYNEERRRVEMHLVSRKRQKVRLCGRVVEFGEAETIHTECSYKYTVESFGKLARSAGWTPTAVWTDPQGYFSVQALVCG